MAQSIITQVQKGDCNDVKTTPRTKADLGPVKSKRTLFRSLFCCLPAVPTEGYVEQNDFRETSQSRDVFRMPSDALLPPLLPCHKGRKSLVLDLDETLVHSSFKPVINADFIIPVEIEDQTHQVYVLKRPGVDKFMKRVGELFEVVVFTASLAKYADPVLDLLDVHRVTAARLFREACVNHKGNFVKDLSKLGRELKASIIVDNSPASYLFHPNHAVPIDSWFDDMNDTELYDLVPILEELVKVDDVTTVLGKYNS